METKQIYKENEDIPERLIYALSSEQNTEITKLFAGLPTVLEKVEFVLVLLSKYNLLPKLIDDSKDNEKATSLRTKGNKLFSLKKNQEALETYTYSIALAEKESENLALAYANRSAALFRLGMFNECLSDIQKALENNYPESLRNKIIERKEKSLNLKAKQKKMPYFQSVPEINVNERNPLIEGASNAIEIKSDSKQGRYLVASRDIEIGEVLVVEKPTFAILTDAEWCHCYHCLTLCYCLIPCDTCTRVLFCSSTCKDEATSYHKVECPILATIASLGYNSCRCMPLRIAILMKDRYEKQEDIESSKNVYKSGRYKEIHDLVTNEEFRTPTDLFERTICTAIFYKLLKDNTDFFENCDDSTDNFVDLVFRHLQTMACNFHDISELCENSDGIYYGSSIGSGAYNVLSLFNHSCAPNVCRTSYGIVNTVFAIESIKKGEQLFDNYGFHFAVHPKSTRKTKLKKQYYFDCECKACINNWGTLPNLEHSLEASMMMAPIIECVEDLSNANVQVAKEVRPVIIQIMKKLEKDMPSYEFFQAQEIFKQCDLTLGSVRISLKSEFF